MIDVEAAAWVDDRVPDFVAVVVSPRTLRLAIVAAAVGGCSGGGVGSRGMASIIRFWNSRCFACKRSTGDA